MRREGCHSLGNAEVKKQGIRSKTDSVNKITEVAVRLGKVELRSVS